MSNVRAPWLLARFSEARTRYFSNSGDRCVPERLAKVDSKGNLELKITGKRDLYSEIQSHKDSCDLRIIVDRIINGDAYALQKLKAKEAMYGDFASMPKNKAELLNQVIAAKDYFDNLPVSVKEQFNNNWQEFFINYDENMTIDNEKVMSTSVNDSTTSSVSDAPAATE